MYEREKKFHFDNNYVNAPQQFGCVNLWQIGDLCSNEGYKVAAHKQFCHEITCIVAGSGTFIADGKSYRVKSGDLFLSPINSEHAIQSSYHAPLRFYYCGFTLDKNHPDYPIYRSVDHMFYTLTTPMAVDRYMVRNIYSILFNEIMVNDSSRDVLIKAGLAQLLLLTQRCHENSQVLQCRLHQNDNFKQCLVYEIIQYIDNNLANIQKMTDISAHFGYSYSYVSQTFSTIMKCSLVNYYQQKRFDRALELLKERNSITQVAEILGFDSIQSFSRSFKQRYGSSPTKYLSDQLEKSRQSEK